MRTNLKFIGVILFIMFFFVGGFFINATKTEASSTVKSLGVTYSISSVISTTNSNGSVTTKILVGCAPKSGDIYDINTGKPCTNNVQTVLTGCAAGSGDVYDVNTGIACASYIKSVLVGCGIGSGDNYDINTGNKCKESEVIIKSGVIGKLLPTQTLTPKDLTLLAPANNDAIASNTTTDANSDLSGREALKNSLTASAAKAKDILKGPMSVWIILLILAIVLGGGYAVYSLISKKDKKNEIKQPINTKPVTPQAAPVTPAKSINSSTPATPEPTVNPQNNNNNPSVTSNTPNPQGQIFGK